MNDTGNTTCRNRRHLRPTNSFVESSTHHTGPTPVRHQPPTLTRSLETGCNDDVGTSHNLNHEGEERGDIRPNAPVIVQKLPLASRRLQPHNELGLKESTEPRTRSRTRSTVLRTVTDY